MRTARYAAGCCFYGVLFLASAMGQGKSSWPCIDEVAKASEAHKIRLSAGVARRLVQKKVLPEVADLRGKDLDSLVIVNVIVDTKGNVRCARSEQGESELFPRSIDAAEQWQFKPFEANGEALVVDTHIQFRFKKNKVEIVFPDR